MSDRVRMCIFASGQNAAEPARSNSLKIACMARLTPVDTTSRAPSPARAAPLERREGRGHNGDHTRHRPPSGIQEHPYRVERGVGTRGPAADPFGVLAPQLVITLVAAVNEEHGVTVGLDEGARQYRFVFGSAEGAFRSLRRLRGTARRRYFGPCATGLGSR